MSPVQPQFTCANCHVDIRHDIVFHVGLAFCCAGCVADGPCTCSYDQEIPHALAEIRPEPALVDDRDRLVLLAS